MIKHIVMWRLKEEAEGATKAENIQKMKEMLLALPGVISEIIRLEVGINSLASPAAYDVVLYSEFANFDGLNAYQIHPEHEKCKDFIGKITCDRAVVDYEI